MPELPEVETIRQQLIKTIKNKKIKEVKVLQPRMINVSAHEFIDRVQNSKIINIRRRAKLLIIDLSSGHSLIVHLKLTGLLIYSQEPDKYTNVVFEFTDGKKLLYKDIRKLGWMKMLKTEKVEEFLKKEGFGPEVLAKDFILEDFKKLLKTKPKAKIKPLLMDQTFLAGIGNVYAQEACFYAKINPQRKVNTLSQKEIKDLYDNLRKVLVWALKHKGASVDAYLDIYGKPGQFLPFLKVYGRGGKNVQDASLSLKKLDFKEEERLSVRNVKNSRTLACSC